MTLDTRPRGPLERFVSDTVIDDYRDIEPSSERSFGGLRNWFSLPAALVIGLLVSAAIITTQVSEQSRQQTRTELVERVEQLGAIVDEREADVAVQSESVSALQSRLLEESSDPRRGEQIASLSVAAAATALNGPGLTVTVDDAPDAQAGSLNRVLDRDLQDIVNALWQMGATGISVNEQRLTAATAIRGAGEAILVNYRPLARPYVISALGTTTTGDEVSSVQRLLDGLATDYGLVSEVQTGDVTLPAGEVRSPRFARVVEGQS